MEQQSFSDSNVYMMAYAKALWQSIKKKQRNITIIALVLMFIVELFVASLRGFGSPTGHVGNYSVIESIYPIMVIACCLVASFGMSSKNQISAKRLSAFKEWLVRFGIFVVLPTLFFLFLWASNRPLCSQSFIATSTLGDGILPFKGRLLLTYHTLSHIVFLPCIHILRKVFVCFRLCNHTVFLHHSACNPAKREVLAQRLVRGFAPCNSFYHRHDGDINRSFLHHIMV